MLDINQSGLWPSAPWWRVLGKSWWYRRVPPVTADWHLHINRQPVHPFSSQSRRISRLILRTTPDLPAAEREKYLGCGSSCQENSAELCSFAAIWRKSKDWHFTSRTFAYCSFTSSAELETFLAVSFSRLSNALASDWTESRLILRSKGDKRQVLEIFDKIVEEKKIKTKFAWKISIPCCLFTYGYFIR